VPGSWNLVAPTTERVFTYSSGTIMQISKFPDISMFGYGISDVVDFKLYRDTNNSSGLFGGSDSFSGDAVVKEFDVHIERNSLGSDEEYTK
jgi:hypothetical protein